MALGVGCAQDVGDIDRTQPDKVKKAIFQTDDQWYYRQTVVGTDMQGSVIFAALESDLKRIRWEVTETMLYAYSAVELMEGHMKGFDDPETRRLGAVAAFPITGHFDVQRSYNAATGEQSNVIVENSSDNPWYDRAYMRVDWSSNVVDGRYMFQNWLGGMAASKSRLQEQGKVDPDRTRVSGDYLDAVTEYNYQPDVMACYGAYGLDAIFKCEAGRLRVRSSFSKVNPVATYEPFQFTDTVDITRDGKHLGPKMHTTSLYDSSVGFMMEVDCADPKAADFFRRNYGSDAERQCSPASFDLFSRFGYFRTEGVTYDRFIGTSDDQRRYYANRWNIWETMFDAKGDVLDMKARTPKPITYHLNVEYPEMMFDAAQVVAKEWDKAFRGAVLVAQGITDAQLDKVLMDNYGHKHMYRIVENSCHPGPLAAWKSEFGSDSADRSSVSDIFTEYVGTATGAAFEKALWNLTNKTRTQLCAELEYATELRAPEAKPFDWERVGDLRFSFFNWVESDVPWAGYGPSAADPLTGELVSGNANFAGAYIRRISTYAADLIQYFNGELADDEIRYGTHIRKELQAEALASRSQPLSVEGKREIARRAGTVADEVSPTNFAARPEIKDLDPFILGHGKDRIMMEVDRVVTNSKEVAGMDTRRVEFLDRPEIKQLLLQDAEMNEAVKAIAMERFGPEADQHAMHQAYLELFDPSLANHRFESRSRFLSDRNILTLDTLQRSAETLATYRGVADYFAGKPREDIIKYFLNNMFIGTQLHEVGHTVGLRHNFAASTDALNYHDEYWAIEKAIADGVITSSQAHSLQGQLARDVTGRDDVDYVSQDEFRLASVMDYTGDLTGRFGGLGKYDIAAINFAYAESVQQWKPDVALPNLLNYETWLSDYKELPRIFANAGGSGPATNPEVQKRGIDVILTGREWVPIKDSMEQRRLGILANTTNWAGGQFSQNNKPFINRTIDYSFCTDNQNGNTLNCAVFDYGANQREVVNHAFDTYRAFQPFWRYKRHAINRGWENYSGYMNRVYNTLMTIDTPFRYYSIYRWWDLGSYTDDLREAAIDAINFYGELLAMPEPGDYCPFGSSTNINTAWYYDLTDVYVPARWDSNRSGCANRLTIGKGIGQYYGFSFTGEYEFRVERIGTYIDKSLATQMMFNINANFAGSAFFTDFRATNISYWTLFRDEFLGMIRGMLLGDYKGFGGVYDGLKYQSPVVVDKANFGRGAVNPQASMPRIYTPISFNHQFNMLVGGMLSSSGWQDRQVDFAQYVKIAVTNNELQPFPEDWDIIEFVHPTTGQIYVAPQTADGLSISYEMVEWANRLKVRYLEAKVTRDAATPGTGTWESANRILTGRSDQMEDVVAKLDMIRYVWAALGPNALR
ncbi:MAG: zinc-dependent metalloprotease [Bradymonadaceae bacterium]|nr:zinc-dependent metalloprotease [Lujinxingiaceae bacterium]